MRIEERRDEILRIVATHRGRSVELFGSAARGDDTDSSDIDLLVEFDPDSSLFDLLHMQDDLTALLGRRVDVVSTRALTPRDEHIRHDAVPL